MAKTVFSITGFLKPKFHYVDVPLTSATSPHYYFLAVNPIKFVHSVYYTSSIRFELDTFYICFRAVLSYLTVKVNEKRK